MTRECLIFLWIPAVLAAGNCCATTTYSDSGTFLSDVQPGYYLETFDSESTLHNLGSPLTFSSGGFSYTATASGGPFPDNAQFYGSRENFGSNPVLSVNNQDVEMVFDFSSNVTAVGGTFFMEDNTQSVTTGIMTLTLADGTSVTINEDTPFYGFTSADPIASLTITSNRFSAVDNLYVGAEVTPEPASFGMLGLGIALVLALRRRTIKAVHEPSYHSPGR